MTHWKEEESPSCPVEFGQWVDSMMKEESMTVAKTAPDNLELQSIPNLCNKAIAWCIDALKHTGWVVECMKQWLAKKGIILHGIWRVAGHMWLGTLVLVELLNCIWFWVHLLLWMLLTKAGSCISAIVHRNQRQCKEVFVQVGLESCLVVTVRDDMTDTVHGINLKVAKYLNCKKDEFRLSYCGRDLCHGTLVSNGIPAQSTLFMLGRLFGGCPSTQESDNPEDQYQCDSGMASASESDGQGENRSILQEAEGKDLNLPYILRRKRNYHP